MLQWWYRHSFVGNAARICDTHKFGIVAQKEVCKRIYGLKAYVYLIIKFLGYFMI